MSSILTNAGALARLLFAELDSRIEKQDVQRVPWGDGVLWPNSRSINGASSIGVGDDANSYSGSYQASAPLGKCPGGAESPYLCHKTTEWMLADTRITQLATNTTLGTATRFDTASKTIYCPEVAERVFESVRLVMTFRSEWAATNGVTGVRMGIKLGTGPTVDYDRTPASQNTASRNIFDSWDVDVTDYFAANFGSGANQTCVASIAVASTTAANINGITFRLVMTYAFDPKGSTTRIKTIRIPIQSHSTTLTTAQQEIGIDGVNPAPTGQIPALDTFLPELSKTYRQCFLDLYANDGNNSGVTAFTPAIQIDATAAVNRATIDCTILPFLKWRDQYDLTGLGLSTAATHIVNMIGDATTTARLCWPGGFLVVTYEYDHPSTLANNVAIYDAMIPMTEGSSDNPPSQQYPGLNGSLTTTDLSVGHVYTAVLNIQEPGTPTILQSGVFAMEHVGAAANAALKAIGNQSTARTSTPAASTQGPSPIIMRGESAWTLQRGVNRLTMTLLGAGRTMQDSAYAVINYTAGIRQDVDYGNHVINHVGHTYDNLISGSPFAIDVSRDAWGNRPPVLGSPFSISAVIADVWMRNQANLCGDPLAVKQAPGEWDGGWTVVGHGVATGGGAGVAVTQSLRVFFPLTRSVNLDNLHTGKLDITKRRRTLGIATNTNPVFGAWSWWVTYNQHAFVVGGTITIDGQAAADGNTVQILAIGPTILDSNPAAAELVATVKIAGGAGAFSATVPDSTRSYFAVYQNNGVAVASSAGAPV